MSITPQRPTRSQFIEKLHGLLEQPFDGDALRWASDNAFEISANDAKARHALSPQWEFRSLSSFIRQLSYYGFRRLSDRRRSSERRSSSTGFIVFSHPTGFFLRGDASQLEGIIRKIRSRPEKGKRAGNRRVSVASVSSMDGMDDYAPPSHSVPLALPPVHQSGWQAPDFRPQYAEDRRPLTTFLPSFQSPFAHYTPTASTSSSSTSGPPPRHADITTWRAYTPATSTWQPASSSNSSAPYDRYSNRRSSIPDFKFAPSMTLSSTKEETVVEERPRLRKAASSLCIQTTNHHTNHGETGFRQSPYPTPTISPAYNSYFPSSNPQVPIAAECSPQSQPSGLPYTPYIPPHHQHQQQVAPRHHQQHQQLQQHRGSSHPALPSPTSSDPSPHSPPHAEYVPLGLDPRQLVHPVSPRNPHQDYYEQPQQAETYFNDNPPPMALGGGGWQQAQVTGA